ncbi:heavy metal translocating P-type ATPase [Rheinheimera nanhaiensis]|uniref:Cu2+-exporting ATPase n=1 Tax=Rheinheimera nanhaiensis E407-8 TaxID=562729 RepID=I1DYD9_9GAMM|nr:heavy metal translocating P-type ATPase [Rheinheimera nanhaiensis]GAB59067.1 Cu2+-exporting ATPase [Rheinheimera nanhaiensis E407-8]
MSDTRCFHCHEPVPAGFNFSLMFDGQQRVFCCAGCQAVADTIIASNLADYYRFRTEPANKAKALPEQLKAELSQFDAADVLTDVSRQLGDLTEIELSVSGISCAACAWLIEKQLRQLPSVHKVNVNSTTQRCHLSWDARQVPLSGILQKLADIGYQASPFVADQEEQRYKTELSRFLKRLAVSGIMTMQVMMLAVALYFGDYTGIEASHQGYLRWISMLLTLPVVLYAALPFVKSAWRGIKARQMNMDVPVSLAIYYTFFASAYATAFNTGEVYFESVCMFTFLLQLGKFFEYRARARARDATSNLLKIMPVSATLLKGQQQETVSAKRLRPGDIILVKPGETLAADGEVLLGSSSTDESMLTGEYRPIAKTVGDNVLAGTVNHDGLLQVQVTNALDNSRLGQIIQLQQRTLSQKPAVLEKTDKLARYFVERLLLIAAATFLLWYFWLDADRAFWVTLSVLVATCPCALSLAAPTAVTCALASLNRRGVLIKNSAALDLLPELSIVVFDKTGTLTEGRFSLQQCHLYTDTVSETEALNLIANLEAYSEHPISRAFSSYLAQKLPLEDVSITVGGGISARYQDKKLKVGSAAFCGLLQSDAMVNLTIDEQPIAAVNLQDALRPEVPELLATLRQQGYQLMMLTGDSSSQADALQQQLQFDQMIKGCSPEQKVAEITRLVEDGHKVMMLGDGINDSPAFHAAHVSVTLDSGSDLSKNQADVVLLQPNITLLHDLLHGSLAAKQVIKQNLRWSVGYNLLIIPLAVAGFVSPYIAVLGMSFSSLLVVSNSLRLLKK